MIRGRLKGIAQSAREPLIVGMLGLPACWPLLQSTLPRSFDGLFHLFRLLQLDHLLRQGILYSRWAPDLYYGYGYPIFNFVPSLPYYLAEILHLTGLGLVDTTLFSFALSVLASGVTMYFFVKDVFGSRAAVVSAVAYMYAPFHLYDILFRGHLPGAWATVLYPLVLWSFRRLILRGGTRYLVASALSYAASFLTHNPAMLIFNPFLLLYVVVLLWLRRRESPTTAVRVVTAMVIGAGLASFFWLPALSDREWIQLDRMITPPDLDYHTHFVSPIELLAPSPAADTGLMNPGVPNNIGPVFVLLSLVSAVGLSRFRRPEERIHVILSLLTLAAVVFMVLPQSAFVWENLPFLKYLAYPHRFLRLGSLVVAILCGAAVNLFPRNRRTLSPSFLMATVSIVIIIVCSFSLLYPPYYRDLPRDPSFAHMMEFERRTGTIGTTSFGEYLPTWVEWISTSSPLETMYRASAPVERLDHTSLPDGTEILEARYGPNSILMRLDAPQSFQATINSLYFPGWRALVDGDEISILPTPGLGLISVAIPAGEHLIEIRFQDMPIHWWSKLTAGLSLMLLLLILLSVAIRPPQMRHATSLFRQEGSPDQAIGGNCKLGGWQASVLISIAVILLILKVGYIDQRETYFKRDFDGFHVKGVQNPAQANFGDQITLLGYDLSASDVQPGDTLDLNLYWKARQSLTTDYSSFVHVVDEEMNIYAQKDSLNPGRYPTRLWEVDEYNRDSHTIMIPPGTPPGDYILGAGLYDPAALTRLPILGEERHQYGMLILQEITILKSAGPPSVEALGIQQSMNVHFDNGMTLLGYSSEREELIRGDFYRIALFWESTQTLDGNYSVSLRLLNREGDVALRHTSEPSVGRYPTSVWDEGEVVRDNHSLWIPRDFPSGKYVLQLAVLGPDQQMVSPSLVPQVRPAQGWLELTSMHTGD